jgi:hypothetical protein
MLGLGFPEVTRRRHFSHDPAGPYPEASMSAIVSSATVR